MTMKQLKTLCDLYPDEAIIDMDMTIRFHHSGSLVESTVIWPSPKGSKPKLVLCPQSPIATAFREKTKH